MFILVFFILFAILFVIYHFTNHNYYKKKKFIILLTLLGTISSILLASSIIVQFFSYNNRLTEEVISKYGDYSKEFLDEVLVLFINHPELQYYYDDLSGTKKINEYTIRNLTLEKEITMLMFSKFAKTTVFIQHSTNTEEVKYVEKWMKHVLDTYMKSDTFKHYYINEYKPKFSGPSMVKYMKDNYNL